MIVLKTWINVIVISTQVGFGTPAKAEQSLKLGDFVDVVQKSKGDDKLRQMIFAAGEAYAWANSELAEREDSPFYCQPKKLGITRDQYADILVRYVSENPTFRSNDFRVWHLLLLKGLEVTFPCK